jgi:monoamine oxidase
LAQHLIQERFKLETWPFSMDDEDTFIFFNGTSLRRSEFHPDKLNLALPAHEQGQLPDELLRRALRPLTELIAQADGWERLLAEYDGYSLIDFLRQSDISDTALAMIGPLLNLEGRFHFSLVEWFSHYYDNVFGDLVYLVDGADALPNAFAPGLMPDIKLGAEVHAIFQGTEGVTVHYKDPTGYSQSVTADECILTVPFILLRHLEIRGLDVSKWYARVW